MEAEDEMKKKYPDLFLEVSFSLRGVECDRISCFLPIFMIF